MRYLLRIAKSDRDLNTHAIDVPDAEGKNSKLTVWNYLSEDDIYSMIGRGERMVGVMEQLLGDEVYHYHSKMMLKEPKVGGAWEWHQDFGYWYKNGVLAPRLASGLIAVDRATKANGCLQVLKGSHHFGRIEHGVSGGQSGVDMDYLEAIARQSEKVYIECEAGDVLFFHCNLLHASAPNESDYPRWSLICCYNARSNDPIRKSHHPNYHPLNRVPDSAIVEYGRRWVERVERGEKVESSKERLSAFLDPDDDESTPGSKRAEA
jgi:ectoine hydroxylase